MQLRVAFTFEIFRPAVNGIINATANLAENLIKEGHEVFCIIPKWRKSPKFLLDNAAPVIPVPSFNSFVYPGLRFTLPWSTVPKRTIKKYGINIIHLTAPGFVGKKAMQTAHALNIPVVHTWHTMLTERHYLKHMFRFNAIIPMVQALSWKYYKPYIRNCDAVTTPTEAVADILNSQYPGVNVRTISNGLDVESFNEHGSLEELKKIFPSFNTSSLLFLGRVSQEKSIDAVISALAKAVARDPQLQLFIIGDGPALPELKKLAARLNISRHLHFAGPWSHQKVRASRILHHARAMVSASETETQGLTFIEAMCCNTPVVTIDSAVTRSVIGNAGLFFPPRNTDALAECLLTIVHDNQVYKSLAAACIKQAQQYDGKRVTKQFIELYYELLERS